MANDAKRNQIDRIYYVCDFGRIHGRYRTCSCKERKFVDLSRFNEFKRNAGIMFNSDIFAFGITELFNLFSTNPNMKHDDPIAREMQERVMRFTNRRRKL